MLRLLRSPSVGVSRSVPLCIHSLHKNSSRLFAVASTATISNNTNNNTDNTNNTNNTASDSSVASSSSSPPSSSSSSSSTGSDAFNPFQDMAVIAPRLHMPKPELSKPHNLLRLAEDDTELEAVSRAVSINTANTAELRRMRVAELVERFARRPGDTGSSEVQIACLTDRIEHLERHQKIHKRDIHLKRNLARIKDHRYRLMLYLARTNFDRYRLVVRGMNIPVTEPETRESLAEARKKEENSAARKGTRDRRSEKSAREERLARRRARRETATTASAGASSSS